jgi:hypothetical protein
MGDAARYHTIMYEALWLGKEPTWTPEERKRMQERKAENIKQGIGTAPSTSDLGQLEALMKRAAELKAKRELEPPSE